MRLLLLFLFIESFASIKKLNIIKFEKKFSSSFISCKVITKISCSDSIFFDFKKSELKKKNTENFYYLNDCWISSLEQKIKFIKKNRVSTIDERVILKKLSKAVDVNISRMAAFRIYLVGFRKKFIIIFHENSYSNAITIHELSGEIVYGEFNSKLEVKKSKIKLELLQDIGIQKIDDIDSLISNENLIIDVF